MFAGKGLWNIAADIATQKPKLVGFLVKMALEMGNAQKTTKI